MVCGMVWALAGNRGDDQGGWQGDVGREMSEQAKEVFCQSCAKFKRDCKLILPNPKCKQRVWRCQTCIDARKQFAGLRKRVA